MFLFNFVRRHAKAILFTVIMFALSGAALTWVMPISLFPDVTFPRIVILADNGEQPVERMMIEVTKPLEEVASAIPGVRVVRSIGILPDIDRVVGTSGPGRLVGVDSLIQLTVRGNLRNG